MWTLGLISDTHGHLPPAALDAFAGVDEIVHAGDVGGEAVIALLSTVAPTLVVAGNTDPQSRWPGLLRVRREGLRVMILHDIGLVDRPSPDLLRRARGDGTDLVLFGHSHRPADDLFAGIRFVNPGSAGAPRGGVPATVARLAIDGAAVEVRLLALP